MKKMIKTDRCELYNYDCIEMMDLLIAEGKKVDLTVTSPPYDDTRDYEGTLIWDFDVFKQVAQRLYDITKDGGVVVWVVGDKTVKGSETGTSFKQALYFKEIGFNLHDTMIYHKRNPMPIQHNRYQPSFEYMFVLSKGKLNTFNPILTDTVNPNGKLTTSQRESNGLKHKGNGYGRQRNKKRYLQNVWSYKVGKNQTTKDDIAFQHPAIFPEKLAQDHILSWSNEGDIILDCFMGSGTTGKIALLNNRKFIGIEKVEQYFEISKQRIENIK